MGTERVATFQALIDRAGILLDRGDTFGDPKAVKEALLLLDYVRQRYDAPFSTGEISLLVDGAEEERRTSRTLLDAVRLKRLVKALTEFPSSTLTAAE